MDEPVFIIGFMGSGKSTAGKKLAKIMGYSFIDLDEVIENRYKVSIPQIFDKYDENAFRKIEHDTLKSILNLKNHVISTGGGTPCFYNNMELINESGITVYLTMHPKSIYQRLLNSKKKRPLIQNKTKEETIHFIEEVLSRREKYYSQADISVKGENISLDMLADTIKAKKYT